MDRAICPSTVTIGSAQGRELRGGRTPGPEHFGEHLVGRTAYGCGPDTGCADALWSLCRVTPTPSRLPQALIASLAGQSSADWASKPPRPLPCLRWPPSVVPPGTPHSPAASSSVSRVVLMLRAPQPVQAVAHPRAGSRRCTRQLPAGGTPRGMGLLTRGTPSARSAARAPPPAVAQGRYGRPRGPSPASGDTVHTTAPPASAARGHGGATVAESPPRTMSSVGERQARRRPPLPRAIGEGDAVAVVRHQAGVLDRAARRYRARYVTTPAP